jgi:hypothetical protein
MNASSIVYLKAAGASLVRTTEAETARAKKVAPRRWFFRRSSASQTTTFQRCLALHLFVAERYGALD